MAPMGMGIEMSNMTEATVYSLTATQVFVTNNYYEFRTFNKPLVLRNGLFAEVCDFDAESTVQLHRWPIETFRRIMPNGSIVDTYLAIDPELRYMFEQPIRVELTGQISALKQRASVAEELYTHVISKLSNFSQLPWYKRVWLLSKNYV